ncbi:GIY-YIG catalytic domain-containing protein [Nitrosospira sp. Nsp11]|uniref:GIY-YIG nuclease family protein n=1 Tax=Nitrosospira sp. Nsp11 TaxID=1855338 RepID=UPI00092033CF|nr:GIY-YIG catalytic domain-containing protein [Nitrosospira sp. Nsp11]
MKVSALIPRPARSEPFRRNRERFIPENQGCYVLTTFDSTVLYIGLTTNLRRRIIDHLDSNQKTLPTATGRAVLFFWIESNEINKIERTWLNTHIQHEGAKPVLNKIYSPVSV